MLKVLKKYRAPCLFIMSFFILFLVFQLVPTIWTFYVSLTNWEGIGTPNFCGFNNYRKMLTDGMFWESLGNTVIYWLTGLVFVICYALFIASLLSNGYLKSNSTRAFSEMATFLPNICTTIAMGLVSRMLFDENVGLVNELVAVFGGSRLSWLTNTTFSRIPVIILNVWRYTPQFTVILLSGPLNIPKDYYEAAAVDGVNGWQQFWFITLLSLKNILFSCSVTLTVDMRKLSNESYILPGPGASNLSLFQYMCESGFSVFNMGYASAIGVVLILILIVISIIQFVVRHKRGEIQRSS